MTKTSIKDLNNYIKNNNLINSYIDPKFLYQVRSTKPSTMLVVKTDDYTILFEETQGSLRNRHYGYKDKTTSFNLLIIENNKTRLFTKDDLDKLQENINYNGWTKEKIIEYLKNDRPRKNHERKKTGRKSFIIRLTEDERPIVWEFVKKLRDLKK